MTDNTHQPGIPATGPEADKRYRHRLVLGFGLFVLFFVFYVGTAVIQTPAFSHVSSIPFLGMPLGLFLSVAIFPASWVLIVIFFAKGK